ncbi:MAG: hypothetical protein KatS3mg035_0118 [Bacteroidia bacterium]|nr:MAG: hypothetical protein KatS3mg035_0118 [Bacteroidia bacterium]
MKYLFFFISIILSSANAQYHLDEIGMQLGAGTNLPIGADQLSPYYAYNACGFYTRYRCGKKDGFLLEGGTRGFSVLEKPTNNSFLQPDNNQKMNFHFIYLFLGAHYKFRFKDFHRDNEWAFLIGTKADFRFTSLHQSDLNKKLQRYNSDNYRTIYGFLPGISISAWIRKSYAPKKSFFIRPGIDYFLKNTVSTQSNLRFENLHLFINLGFIFWNNL